MAKEKNIYVCNNCGQESPKWIGKCPSCGQWNTFVEETVHKTATQSQHLCFHENKKVKPVNINDIS